MNNLYKKPHVLNHICILLMFILYFFRLFGLSVIVDDASFEFLLIRGITAFLLDAMLFAIVWSIFNPNDYDDSVATVIGYQTFVLFFTSMSNVALVHYYLTYWAG